jgi:hypothetical protein
MLTTNIKMTPELQTIFEEVVKPLHDDNFVTVVTLMADGKKYYQEFDDISSGVLSYTAELSWALDNEEYVSEVICFICANPREEVPKYLFHAYGFAGNDTNVPDLSKGSEEASEE